MTSEKRLNLLHKALVDYCDKAGLPECLPNDVEESLNAWSKYDGTPAIAAIAALMLEEKEKMDTQRPGGKTQLAALKRIVRNAKKRGRTELNGGWVDDAGRYCVCDGFHAVRLMGATFDCIPTVAAFKGLDDVMNTDRKNLVPVTLPTLAECKTWRSTHKGERIVIDGGTRYLDVEYLIDMLETLPDAKAVAEKSPKSPIWFRDDDGNDGILLPCHPPKK